MSDNINFAPSSRPSRRTQPRSGSIEYSSGEEDASQSPVTPPSQPEAPKEPKPKKEHTFSLWRKNREKKSAPVAAPAAIPVQQKPLTHDAPTHQKETAAIDLLHAPAPAPLHPASRPVVRTPLTPIQPARPAARTVEPAVSPSSLVREREQDRKARLVDELPVTEVNLIPDTVMDEMEKRSRLRDLGYIGLIVVAVILLAYGGLNMYQRKITTDTVAVETDIQQLDQEIAAYHGTQEDAQLVSERLESLTQVLHEHVYWTPFLKLIEDLTLPTVYYQSVNGSVSTRSFTFTSVAESYSQIAPQVAVFRASPYVAEVTVSGAEAFHSSSVISDSAPTQEGLSGVSFLLTVEFTPDTFVHPQLREYAKN